MGYNVGVKLEYKSKYIFGDMLFLKEYIKLSSFKVDKLTQVINVKIINLGIIWVLKQKNTGKQRCTPGK